jgi:hypothetical protein
MLPIRRDSNGNVTNFKELLDRCSDKRIDRAIERLTTTEGYNELCKAFPGMPKTVSNRFVDAETLVCNELIEIICAGLYPEFTIKLKLINKLRRMFGNA